MPVVADARNNIYQEEVVYKAAVSEAVGSKIAGAINFINNKQNKHFDMGVTGGFSVLTVPYTDIGAQEVFETASEITNVFVKYGVAGTASTSELDIEWAADNSGTWASIFSTTPKVGNAASDNNVFDANTVCTLPANCTRPVLSKTTFAAGDKIRCNIVTAATGADTMVLKIEFRPI